MGVWILVPCLVELRAGFNRIAPGRDRTTDGSVGDSNHASSSDHTPDEDSDVLRDHDGDAKNEVHAIDVDVDLRTDGLSMEEVVQFLVSRCRSGAEKRLKYIIFNKRIWSASSGWVQQSYSGSNSHTAHAHFSASYNTTHEANTASWRLEDLVALTTEDKAWIENLFERGTQTDGSGTITSKIGKDAWDQGIPNGVTGVKGPAWAALRDVANTARETKALVTLIAQADDEVDEAAIVEGVLAGLNSEVLAARIAAALPADQAKKVADELYRRLQA